MSELMLFSLILSVLVFMPGSVAMYLVKIHGPFSIIWESNYL